MKTLKQITKTIENLGQILETGEDGMACVIRYGSVDFKIIASWGGGWEHVSISGKRRCPTWQEMCLFKDIFWKDTECAIQYHPAKQDYKNFHNYCLHLWRPIDGKLPIPPENFV